MRELTSRLVVVALLCASGSAGASPNPAGGNPGTEEETFQLIASDGDVGDLFGGAVGLDADIAVVGATGDDSMGFESGAAYVYERDEGGEGNWGETAKLTASDGASGDLFGRSIAVSGDTIVVGAPFHDDSGVDSGAAYIFRRDEGGPGAWGQVARITPIGAAGRDLFGIDVAISVDTVAVGSLDNEIGQNAGAVFVFERDEGGPEAWSQVAKLTASDGGGGDLFGVSVALTIDTLVVGTPQGYPGAPISGAGAAYIFDRDPGDPQLWNEVAKLIASDGDFGDLFAIAVDIDVDRVVCGSAQDDELGVNAGSAYIFERDQGGPGAWGEVIKLRAFDGSDQDAFGISVVVDGERVVVGSSFDNDRGADSGSGYLFLRDFDNNGLDLWAVESKLNGSDSQAGDRLGQSVAWSGSEVLLGAEGAEKAYFYDLSGFFEPAPSCIILDNFCDRLNLVTDLLSISGVWENWDCDGANVDLAGFPNADANTWRVFCKEAGCPLGNFWAYILDNNSFNYDLWGLDGEPPAFQVQDDEPYTRFDAPCEDVVPLRQGSDVPSVSLLQTLQGMTQGVTTATPEHVAPEGDARDRGDAASKGGTP